MSKFKVKDTVLLVRPHNRFVPASATEITSGRATLTPECDDGFRDHPGCAECRMPRHMGHAVTCSKFRVETQKTDGE